MGRWEKTTLGLGIEDLLLHEFGREVSKIYCVVAKG